MSDDSDISLYVSNDNVTRDCWARYVMYLIKLLLFVVVYQGLLFFVYYRMNDVMQTSFGDSPLQTSSPQLMKEYFTVYPNGHSNTINERLYDDSLVSSSGSSSNQETDYNNIKKYPETEIDSMRAQKDVSLNLYVEEVKMKNQLIQKMNAPSSSSTSGDKKVTGNNRSARSGGRDRGEDTGDRDRDDASGNSKAHRSRK